MPGYNRVNLKPKLKPVTCIPVTVAPRIATKRDITGTKALGGPAVSANRQCAGIIPGTQGTPTISAKRRRSGSGVVSASSTAATQLNPLSITIPSGGINLSLNSNALGSLSSAVSGPSHNVEGTGLRLTGCDSVSLVVSGMEGNVLNGQLLSLPMGNAALGRESGHQFISSNDYSLNTSLDGTSLMLDSSHCSSPPSSPGMVNILSYLFFIFLD